MTWLLPTCLAILALDILIVRRWQRAPIIIGSSISLIVFFGAFLHIRILPHTHGTVLDPWMILFGHALLNPMHWAIICPLAYGFGWRHWNNRERFKFAIIASPPVLMLLGLVVADIFRGPEG